MTAQAGYYGSDEQKNRFKPIDGSDEAYFLQVKADEPGKGDIQVWNEEFVSDKRVGTYKKQEDGTYKFEPNKNWWGGAKGNEVEYFSSNKGMNRTVEKANQTVVQEKLESCKSSGGQNCEDVAQEEANQVTKSDKEIEAEKKAKQEDQAQVDALTKDLETGEGRTDYGTPMTYPLGRHDTQDYMLFEVLKYTPRGLKNDDGTGGPLKSRANKDKGDRKPIATISLPIPANIQDNNNVAWQKDDIDEISKQLGNLTAGALEGKADVEEAKTTAQKGGSVEAAKLAILNSITGVKAMQREKGAVFNENTELLFSGPGLRNFSFSFRLSPRSAPEAKMVQRIIRTFKESMSAKKTEDFFFIKAPNTYWISYMSGETNELHPWLNRFKECALTNMTVQYAPDGTYATFPDGAMTSYLMQLDFKEIEPVFNTDYEESGEDNIGY